MTLNTALQDLNNALLDLQAADYNTYQRPLKKMSASLDSAELREICDELVKGLDFDKFVEESSIGKGTMGGASLDWPTEQSDELGLMIQLIKRGADNPNWFMNFAHEYFSSSSTKLIAGIQKITTSILIPFVRDFSSYVRSSVQNEEILTSQPSDLNKIFIVHGHDEAARESVARFIERLGFEAIILHEQANKGMTIAEKLESNADIGFAVVLLTPDDFGRVKTNKEEESRARQNVIMELGYFMGRLGRDKVCTLKKGDIEIPSDHIGVVYNEYDSAGAWRQALARELNAAGYDVDWNLVMK